MRPSVGPASACIALYQYASGGGSRFVAASWTCFYFLFAIGSKKKKLEPSPPPKQILFRLMQVSGGVHCIIPVLVFSLRPFFFFAKSVVLLRCCTELAGFE